MSGWAIYQELLIISK